MTDMDAVLAARRKTHGEYNDVAGCCQCTKTLWRNQTGWDRLSANQRETLDMIAHKVSRILCGDPDTKDHWDDIAGYAKCSSDRVAVPPDEKKTTTATVHG